VPEVTSNPRYLLRTIEISRDILPAKSPLRASQKTLSCDAGDSG